MKVEPEQLSPRLHAPGKHEELFGPGTAASCGVLKPSATRRQAKRVTKRPGWAMALPLTGGLPSSSPPRPSPNAALSSPALREELRVSEGGRSWLNHAKSYGFV